MDRGRGTEGGGGGGSLMLHIVEAATFSIFYTNMTQKCKDVLTWLHLKG